MRKLFLLLFSLFAVLVLAAAPPRAGKSYRVLMLGDTHYDEMKFHRSKPATANKSGEQSRNLKMWKGASQRLLTAANRRAAAVGAVCAFQLGDISQGDADGPELMRDMLGTAYAKVGSFFPRLQLFPVKGNHDIRLRGKNGKGKSDSGPYRDAILPKLSKMLGVPPLDRANYTLTLGEDLYIVIDGFYPAEDCTEFVKRSLEEHPRARYVFLLTHLPVLPASSGGPFWLLPGHFEIADLLETRNAVILSAHTHSFSLATRTTRRGRIVQLITTSMGAGWNPGSIARSKPFGWKDLVARSHESEKGLQRSGGKDKLMKQWEIMESKGSYTFRKFFANSGFTVIEAAPAGVTAYIYADDSDKPAETVALIGGAAGARGGSSGSAPGRRRGRR